jgi:dolichol-phosphate mannosyltransferase
MQIAGPWTTNNIPPNVQADNKVSVVIPSFKVRDHILEVIAKIGPQVAKIYVVDDRCPLGSGHLVLTECRDPRVTVLFNEENLGVGGATMTGYARALADGCDIVVKLDGDGQMDPSFIPVLIAPIVSGDADYTKGNRFFSPENLEGMPTLRLFGNTALSFISKMSSGYWSVMDPTNGFTAIHATALSLLPLHKIDQRYFFESDILFRLNTIRAVVRDVPMKAVYANEESNLKIGQVLREFPLKHVKRVIKRLGYNYLLRDFNVCSLELLAGMIFLLFGVFFGGYQWYQHMNTATLAPTGTIMLAVLPIIIGVQLLLAAVTLDVMNVPRDPLQQYINNGRGQ